MKGKYKEQARFDYISTLISNMETLRDEEEWHDYWYFSVWTTKIEDKLEQSKQRLDNKLQTKIQVNT